MDCLVCNTRSAVESCVVCHLLLCEICGVKCQMCGGTVCPQHIYTSHSGKVFCLPCQEKRRAARHARHVEKEREESGEGIEAGEEAAQEEEVERPVLVASVRKPPPPWKLSLYIACAGGALALIVLLFPGLRGFTLPWGGYFPTPYLLLLAPVVSVFWGLAGLVIEEQKEDRFRCLIGIGVALVACVLLFVAVFTDPVRVAATEEARVQNAREKMTPAELQQWRQQTVQKFKRQP